MKTTGSDHKNTQSGISNGIIPENYKSIKSIFPLLIISAFFYLVIYTSCANIGSPSGGPKDSIAPVLLQTTPTLRSTNYKEKDVRFTFNEYILPDDIRDNLVISPPMKKKPVIKMKSKTLIVEFPEDLKDSTTYSLDFKDAVVDNNEKNPIEDFRFSFSTGAVFDSLRVTGYVKNALTQEPVEKALIVLHRMAEYTALIDSIPDYIGISNKEGLFMIDNIAPGSYRLYSVTDADNSLTYNSNAELIAFADSLIVPTARFEAKIETVIKGNHTIFTAGPTKFFP